MRIIALIMCFCNYVSSSVKDQIAGEDYLEKKKKKKKKNSSKKTQL